MIHPEPARRPSPVQILQNRALSPDISKSKAELTRELNAEKLRNEMLVKQLKEAAICIKSIASESIKVPLALSKTSTRLIGKKVNRSVSTTTFWGAVLLFFFYFSGVWSCSKFLLGVLVVGREFPNVSEYRRGILWHMMGGNGSNKSTVWWFEMTDGVRILLFGVC